MSDEAYEYQPCGLCDGAGRCTSACENVESVPAPSADQIAAHRYWAMLILAAKVLDDLIKPDPQLRKIAQIQAACGRLRDEIRAVALGEPE